MYKFDIIFPYLSTYLFERSSATSFQVLKKREQNSSFRLAPSHLYCQHFQMCVCIQLNILMYAQYYRFFLVNTYASLDECETCITVTKFKI